MTWKNFPKLGGNKGHINFLTMQDGTRLRTASWPAGQDSRGIIVLVNGHQEYMDKYAEFILELLTRGFGLYTLDNRGQGLSDRMLSDRSKSHAEDFDLFSNDLNEFISTVVKSDPRAGDLPIYLIGHSMGGHICLRYLHDFPGVIRRVILMAPMIDFYLGAEFLRTIAQYGVRLLSRLGFSKNFAFGQNNSLTKAYHLIRQRQLTHDKRRYAIEQDIIKASPDLYVGGATFGWLNTAIDSIDKMHQPGFLDKISLPVMVLLAGQDRVVDSESSRKLFSGHKNITVVTFDGARHEIYRESDDYRDKLWHNIDQFLGVE